MVIERIQVPEEQLNKKVHEYWQSENEWIWHIFDSHLPLSILLKFATTIISNAVEDEGRLFWGEDSDGTLTIGKAYKKFCHSNTQRR